MAEWVKLCGAAEAPRAGEVMEAEALGVAICLANVDGRLCALGNVCPHRQGPLGGGWIEGEAVLCPWHAWAFDVTTGEAAAPEKGKVDVFPVRVEGEDALVEIEQPEPRGLLE